ncbi:UBX domain-containing protein 10 [Melanotaenia boesemani]|uniref:UBX domain-containing protein 10 n=1 Tax=Melanotaenia boesemani TaxID=1250792 RepID=UPI001C0425D6|nr:UBX domain-containing protein 10 [Melanotaenia boesemani]XP_041860118.1 UBX domain-containing protein 10 [Melanotaenia boesemani]
MHLMRPKSSKRRSRPTVNSFLCTNSDSIPRPSESSVNRRPDSSFLSRPDTEMLQAKRLTTDEVVHVLQQAPAAPPQPFNKYNVLPPIERRQSKESPLRSLTKMMSTLDLPNDAVTQPRSTAGGRLRIRPEPSDAARTSGSLLLAIRAPCGRRFEQHFDPSDTLLAVRASAEARYGVRYEGAFIETIAMPRRALTDLDMTLAQCDIQNRSVLCISQSNTSVVEQERD